MVLKRILKIALLVSCILLTALCIILMYTVLIIEKSTFEYSMLFPLTMILTGILSVIYQFKTYKFYSLKVFTPDFKYRFFWIGNALYVLSIFSMIAFILYSIHELKETELTPEIVSVLIICASFFIIGVSILIKKSYSTRKLAIK